MTITLHAPWSYNSLDEGWIWRSVAILQGDWRCPNASGATTCSDASRSVSYSVILEERIPHHVFPKRLYGRRYANNLAYRFNVLIKRCNAEVPDACCYVVS